MPLENRKVTDLQEKATAPVDAWLHFVDKSDVSQDPSGSSYKISKLNYLKEITADVIKSAPFLGAITPTSPNAVTDNAYWLATQNGTYTNHGGVVVGTNSFAIVSVKNGVYSISQTALDISGKVNVLDVINTLTSTDTNKPLSAAQGKILNEKNVKIEVWTAKSYLSGDQVNYLGKDWVSNAATVAGDVPATSTKWVERLVAYSFETQSFTKTVTSREAQTINYLLKKGRSIRYKTSGGTNGAVINTFLYRANGTNVNIGAALETFKEYSLLEDFVSVSFYNNTDAIGYTATFEVLSVYDKITSINDASNVNIQIAIANAETANAKVTSTLLTSVCPNGSREIPLNSTLFKKNKTIRFYLSTINGSNSFSCFLYRANGTYINIGTITSTVKEYKLLEDFTYFKAYNGSDTLGYTLKVEVLAELEALSLVRALIVGDSYSENGGQWVGEMMSKFRADSSYKSLAVSSATLRDKQADRTAYPYTSRPVSANSTGNLNTLSCQIQKLKRLMTGTDLDGGETQIYATAASYPNVIIIEGGMNDTFDLQAVEDTYKSQFSKQVDNVYYKANGGSNTLGTFYIKTPIAEVNRTCFAGSYRYLVEELSALFPDAQIFITTASGLGYWDGDVVDRRTRTANQQKKCAQLCSASVIDWNGEGGINAIVNYPIGIGTVGDPYIMNKTVGDIDTSDAMHPNARGGKKYGRVAALTIKSKYINFNNE